MYASPIEHQRMPSPQNSPADADEDPARAQVDTRRPGAACLGADIAMGVRSSPLPRPGRSTVIGGADADGPVGTRLAAVPIIANARAGSASPGLAPAGRTTIEGATA